MDPAVFSRHHRQTHPSEPTFGSRKFDHARARSTALRRPRRRGRPVHVACVQARKHRAVPAMVVERVGSSPSQTESEKFVCASHGNAGSRVTGLPSSISHRCDANS